MEKNWTKIWNISLAQAALPEVSLEPGSEPWLRYGRDNLYPQQLIKYRHYSPAHQAIINLKADLCAGEGWLNAPEGLAAFLPQPVMRQLALDYALFNGFALELHWSLNGQRIARVQPLNFAQLRSGRPNEQGRVTHWYYSADWQRWQQTGAESARPQALPVYDPQQSRSQPRQVLVFYEYAPELPWYPLAAYHAIIPDLEFEHEYARFRQSSMSRGLFPSLHLHIDGYVSEEDKDRFYEDLKRKFGGSNNAGEVLITYGSEGAGKTTITPLQVTANEGLFDTWARQSQQRIITGHRLSSPVLAGLPGSGSLGGNGNEIAIAFEHFYNSVVRGMQLNLCRTLGQLMPHTIWAGYMPELANLKPIRFVFGENILSQVLTRDELRHEIGYGQMSTAPGGER